MENEFVWDLAKEALNVQKHGIDFRKAAQAFLDPQRKILLDRKHSRFETRYYCIAKMGERIINVRFVHRDGKIRILGAGFWRKGIKYYEEKKI